MEHFTNAGDRVQKPVVELKVTKGSSVGRGLRLLCCSSMCSFIQGNGFFPPQTVCWSIFSKNTNWMAAVPRVTD